MVITPWGEDAAGIQCRGQAYSSTSCDAQDSHPHPQQRTTRLNVSASALKLPAPCSSCSADQGPTVAPLLHAFHCLPAWLAGLTQGDRCLPAWLSQLELPALGLPWAALGLWFEGLMCTRHCCRCWRYSSRGKKREMLVCLELILPHLPHWT